MFILKVRTQIHTDKLRSRKYYKSGQLLLTLPFLKKNRASKLAIFYVVEK